MKERGHDKKKDTRNKDKDEREKNNQEKAGTSISWVHYSGNARMEENKRKNLNVILKTLANMENELHKSV